MQQICTFSDPRCNMDNICTVGNQPFQWKTQTCVNTGISTSTVVGTFPDMFGLYSGIFMFFAVFAFIVLYFKNR